MTTISGFLRFLVASGVSVGMAGLALLAMPFDGGSGRVFHRIAGAWSRMALFVCGIRVRVTGLERLDRSRSYIYVSNHASLLDIPCVIAGIPDEIRIVYKKELEKIPVFGWGLKAGPYISIRREDITSAARSLDEAAEKMRNGASVLLYAEGTRTLDGRLQPFKRGAFNLAAKAGVPVVPLTINGTYDILRKHSLIIRPGTVELILADPIAIPGSGKAVELELMDRVHRAIARNYVDQ